MQAGKRPTVTLEDNGYLLTVMALTDTAIKSAKPADKSVKMTDGNGLYRLGLSGHGFATQAASRIA